MMHLRKLAPDDLKNNPNYLQSCITGRLIYVILLKAPECIICLLNVQ